jgi:hypothetical protein
MTCDPTGVPLTTNEPRPEGVTEYHPVMIKNGTRLQSQVCDTQVIVVRSADSLDDLRAGGAPMIALDAQKDDALSLDQELSGGNAMGKRYVDDGGAEVLVTKAGAGTLSVGSAPLNLKEAKPLPASD